MRQQRTHKLIKLGLICEATGTIEFSQEMILGYLLDIKNKIIDKTEKIDILKEIKTKDNNIIAKLGYEDRKKRNHDLITYGSLFEITKTDNINIASLYNYLEKLPCENKFFLNNCEMVGKTYFLKTNQKKKQLLFYR